MKFIKENIFHVKLSVKFKDDWYQLNGKIIYVKRRMYSINYAKNNRAPAFFKLFQPERHDEKTTKIVESVNCL